VSWVVVVPGRDLGDPLRVLIGCDRLGGRPVLSARRRPWRYGDREAAAHDARRVPREDGRPIVIPWREWVGLPVPAGEGS